MTSKSTIELCQAFVRIPSPSGQEGDLAARVAQEMSGRGFHDVSVDAFGSVVGRLLGATHGPVVLFDVHLDTVAPARPEQWRYGPWDGAIEGGQLWGLGAADVKGSLAALIAGLASLPRADLHGEIVLSASVCEENLTGAALTQILASQHVDVAIIAEPTELRLGSAQRGRGDVLVTAHGRSAHTSQPELGDNAVYKMLEAVSRLRSLPQPGDPELGSGVFELVEIVSEPLPGTAHVPHRCRTRFLARVLPEETDAGFLDRLHAALAGMDGVELSLEPSRQVCYTGATLAHSGFLPGWRTPPEAPWLARLQAALVDAGLGAQTFAARFGCNASACAGAGIPAFIYGPGSLRYAHAVDERISLSELVTGERAFAALARGCLAVHEA